MGFTVLRFTFTRYGGFVVLRSLCRSADAPIAVRCCQWLFRCSVTCKVKKYVPALNLFWPGVGLLQVFCHGQVS